VKAPATRSPGLFSYAGRSADLLGLELPDGVTGRSLRPAIEGEPFASRPELISLYLSKLKPGGERQHMQIYGLRTPEYKFTRSVILKQEEPMAVQAELYDLNRDPGEHRALTDTQHPALRSAWEALEIELERARAAWRDEPRTARERRSTDLSADSVLELRALGYLDEGQGGDDVDPRRPWGLAPMEPLELEPLEGEATRWLGVAGLVAAIALLVWLRRRGRSAAA